MKKSYLFVAALALVLASCGNEEVVKIVEHPAGFEDITLNAESVLHLDETGTFESGDFIFDQEVSGNYFAGNTVSNLTSTTYVKDSYQNDMNVSGEAHSGSNFVVWTQGYGNSDQGIAPADDIRLKSAAVVPGFYINNTPWVVDAILNGDGQSIDGGLPFGDDDFFRLIITGLRNGKEVGSVQIDLANGKDYIKEWTYVSLASLGMIDELQFGFDGSKRNNWGVSTPFYFAFDDLGATAPKEK